MHSKLLSQWLTYNKKVTWVVFTIFTIPGYFLNRPHIYILICIFTYGIMNYQNLKKSWHPSTMKNQERVWKAEQQKAEEDRKMAELQRELKEEREREVLRKTAEESGAIAKRGEEKLDWMYKVSNLS